MPLRPHRYSRKRDSRRAHFRGLGVTHSAQLAKVGTRGGVRELGTDGSQKNKFLTVDIRRWREGERDAAVSGPTSQNHARNRGTGREGFANDKI